MKIRLTLAGLAIAGLTVALATTSGVAFAGTKDLVSICSSARLTATERTDCRKQFKVADSDDARLAIFKEFDNKMHGMKADGSRPGKGELVQDAQAK